MPDKNNFLFLTFHIAFLLGQCLPAELSLLGGKTFLLLFFERLNNDSSYVTLC